MAKPVSGSKSATGGEDLKLFMDKRVDIHLNGNRRVVGVLVSNDKFMNLLLENALEIQSPVEQFELGTVLIRGSSIRMWECLDKVRPIY